MLLKLTKLSNRQNEQITPVLSWSSDGVHQVQQQPIVGESIVSCYTGQLYSKWCGSKLMYLILFSDHVERLLGVVQVPGQHPQDIYGKDHHVEPQV